MAAGEETSVRIDKWLWAARCFKTRSQATAACDRGDCTVDGRQAKASLKVRPGARVEVETPGGQRVLVVVALADKRASAAIAATLFEDHSPPPPPRDPLARILAESTPKREAGSGRPTKRERRLLDKTRGR